MGGASHIHLAHLGGPLLGTLGHYTRRPPRRTHWTARNKARLSGKDKIHKIKYTCICMYLFRCVLFFTLFLHKHSCTHKHAQFVTKPGRGKLIMQSITTRNAGEKLVLPQLRHNCIIFPPLHSAPAHSHGMHKTLEQLRSTHKHTICCCTSLLLHTCTSASAAAAAEISSTWHGDGWRWQATFYIIAVLHDDRRASLA